MKIVAAVDGSPAADHALAWALAEADLHSAVLTVLHVFTIGELAAVRDRDRALESARRAAVDLVRACLERVTGGATDADIAIDVATAHSGGVAAAVLHNTADADLVVLGSRGLGGFSGLVLGSVSQQVAAHATVPVAVVPPAHPPRPTEDAAAPVVVGVDGSTASRRALRWAVEEAGTRGVPVDAIHVHYEVDTLVADITRKAMQVLQEQAAERGRAGLAAIIDEEVGASATIVRPHVIAGSPARVLIEHVATPSSLLVVGSRGRGGFSGLLLGSVSQQCLTHARGPVVVVRAP